MSICKWFLVTESLTKRPHTVVQLMDALTSVRLAQHLIPCLWFWCFFCIAGFIILKLSSSCSSFYLDSSGDKVRLMQQIPLCS